MTYKKAIFILSFLALFGFVLNFNAFETKAITSAEIEARIKELEQQIVQLQQQLAEVQRKKEGWCHNFKVKLRIGDIGPEVRALQIALEKEGLFSIKEDRPSYRFDERLALAVVSFQEKYKGDILAPWGLSHGTGYVGPTTLAKLNELYGCKDVGAKYGQASSMDVCEEKPAQPSITVISPNGGEKWERGSPHNITWTSSGIGDYVRITILKNHQRYCDRKGCLETIIAPNTGSYAWTVDIEPLDNAYTIKIEDEADPSIYDESDNFFSVIGIEEVELENIKNQLVAISQAVEEIAEKLKELLSQETISLSQNKTKTEEISVITKSKPKSTSSEIQLKNKKIVHLPILIYHHIDFLAPGATKLWQDLTVSPPTFEKQMEYLFQQNYQPITFKQFLDFIEKDEKIPENSLIITFDDGWKSQYRYAFPVLKKYNFPATFFIVVNQIGGALFMNWEELKELLKAGMEIGSHTMSHPNLKRLTSSQLIYEIENSKIVLEKNLNSPIEVFAYPYGIFDSRVIKAVRKANYKMARTTISSPYQNIEKMYTLNAIQVYDSLEQFKKIFPPTK